VARSVIVPVVLLVVLFAAACASPGNGSSGRTEPAGSESERSAEGVPPEAPRRPDPAWLVRCGYRVGADSRHLPLKESLVDGTAAAAELRRLILPGVKRAQTTDRPSDRSRSYLVSFSETLDRTESLDPGDELDIEIFEPDGGGPAIVTAQISSDREHVIEVAAPALVKSLREKSFARLQADMLPPWRPLPWHYLALAGFLESAVVLPAPTPGGLIRTAEELPEKLLKHLKTTADVRPLTLALLGHLEAFDEEQLEPFLSSDHVPLRVLALAYGAHLGVRPALREILILSLEYHAETELFHRALSALFPEKANPLLYTRHAADSAGGRLAFLEALRRDFENTAFDAGQGWTVEYGE